MRTIDLPINFEGVVQVSVPDHLNDEDARLLAQEIAKARVFATLKSIGDDEGGEYALFTYQCKCSSEGRQTATDDFDKANPTGIFGRWHIVKD